MPEELGHLLDNLGRSSPASAPPPAFLAAVARRRHRRRLTRAAAGCGVFAVLVAATVVLRAPGPEVPAIPNHSGNLILTAGAEPAPASLGNLARLNPSPGAESLVLPSMPGGGGIDEPLRIGLRWDAAAVERLTAQ